MNSTSRSFRELVYWLLLTTLFLIYTVFVTGFNTNGSYSLFTKVLFFLFLNSITVSLGILLFIIIISLLFSSIIKDYIKKKLSKNRAEKKLTYGIILFAIAAVFCVLVSVYFAIGINVLFKEINLKYFIGVNETYSIIFNLNKVQNYTYFYILISIILFYSFLIYLVRLFFSIIYFEKVSVTIHLKDGSLIEDKFIINHNIDGGIIIGDSYLKKAENKKLLPKSNIHFISFNKVDYSFGERKEKSKVIMPDSVSKDEFDELIKEWRSRQRFQHSNF